jgi:hypothetical protein
MQQPLFAYCQRLLTAKGTCNDNASSSTYVKVALAIDAQHQVVRMKSS